LPGSAAVPCAARLAVFWLLYAGFRLRQRAVSRRPRPLAWHFRSTASPGDRPLPPFRDADRRRALLFLVALIQRRLVLADVFRICLATARMPGFTSLPYCSVIALNRYRGVGWRMQRAEIGFAAVAICYSVSVLALQHAIFTGESSFARSISATRLAEAHCRGLDRAAARLHAISDLHRAAALIAVLWRRRATPISSWATSRSCLGRAAPAGGQRHRGTLSAYYAYPFMIACFWPPIAPSRRAVGHQGPAAYRSCLPAMIAGSWTPSPTSQSRPDPVAGRLPVAALDAQHVAVRPRRDAAVDRTPPSSISRLHSAVMAAIRSRLPL